MELYSVTLAAGPVVLLKESDQYYFSFIYITPSVLLVVYLRTHVKFYQLKYNVLSYLALSMHS